MHFFLKINSRVAMIIQDSRVSFVTNISLSLRLFSLAGLSSTFTNSTFSDEKIYLLTSETALPDLFTKSVQRKFRAQSALIVI